MFEDPTVDALLYLCWWHKNVRVNLSGNKNHRVRGDKVFVSLSPTKFHWAFNEGFFDIGLVDSAGFWIKLTRKGRNRAMDVSSDCLRSLPEFTLAQARARRVKDH